MVTKANVLLTGATGFVGSALLKYLLNQNYHVSVVVRKPIDVASPNLDVLLVDDLSVICQQSKVVANVIIPKLQNIDYVVHCAGHAHNLKHSNFTAEYYLINRDVTAALADAAAKAGVKRFIFISTIGVNGNQTRSNLNPDLPEYFNETDLPNPHNDYAISKLQAEEILWDISKSTSMEVTIIRPPMIYGADAKGNFKLLKKVIDKKIPLPFARVNNLRSVLALDNLVDFIGVCLSHPNAANQVFLIADGEDTSTESLLMQVARASGKKAVLFPLPLKLLVWIAKVTGKQQMAISLLGSLRLDTSKAAKLMGWHPVTTMQQQLEKCFRLR